MSVQYLDLLDYVGIAAEVTGVDEGVVAKVANLTSLTRHSTLRPQALVAKISFPISSTRLQCWS